MASKGVSTVAVVSAALWLAGCGGDQNVPNATGKPSPATAAVNAPAVDASTPDKAVQAIWALSDAKARADCELRKKVLAGPDSDAKQLILQEARGMAGPLAAGGVAKSYADDLARVAACAPDTYLREIKEAKVETESRATVTAQVRNITPIPPNAEESDYGKEKRTKGTTYKYVLTKGAAGWQVEDVFYFTEYGNEFVSLYSDPRPPYPYDTPAL